MFIVDGVDCYHVFEVNKEVPHGFGPAVPTDPFVHFERVDEELSYLELCSVY